jgi:hypothetical protein
MGYEWIEEYARLNVFMSKELHENDTLGSVIENSR